MNSDVLIQLLLVIFLLNLILGIASIGFYLINSKKYGKLVYLLFGCFLIVSFLSLVVLLIGCFMDKGNSIVFSNLATLIVGETVIVSIMAAFSIWKKELDRRKASLKKKKKLANTTVKKIKKFRKWRKKSEINKNSSN